MILLLFACCLLLCNGSPLELEHGFAAGNDGGENGTGKVVDLSRRMKVGESNYLLDRYPIGELSPDTSACRRPAKCVPLIKSTCMGTKLPYAFTTLDLIPERVTQDIIEERLYLLQALKHVPKCWAVVQPFLCSLFMPKCTNDVVELPPQEMCKMVSGPCRMLINHTIWPSFAKCDNTKLFPRSCQNDIRELKFNISGKCLKPLVPTDNALSIFDGVEGCGTQCYDPLYTPDEHNQIHSFIIWAASICCTFNLFTIITFLIDWRSANRYPAVVIFYINACFMVSCIGWLVQFTPGSRDVIVCRKDGTLRTKEPSGENLSCVVVFVLVYYSLMAAVVWSVIFTYAWHNVNLRAFGKIDWQDRVDKKSAYFHLIAWCVPLVLTVAIMALGRIDGNSMMGICFVGYADHVAKIFVLGPVLLAVLIGGYFICRGLYMLIHAEIIDQAFMSERDKSKINQNCVRIGLFSIATLAAVVVTFYCHIYEIENLQEWQQSFRSYMICTIVTKYADVSECKMSMRPSTGKLQLHLLALFSIGILNSSWIWTSSTVDIWCRFLRRIFNRESEEIPIRLSKHKLIAHLFANRKTFNKAGRLSISFHNTHADPVGLNFDLNSAASQDISSTWAAALPKLVTRRGALVGGTAGSVSSNRRNSGDSEISCSYQWVSMESRRNSLDSQISVQIAQVKTTRKVGASRSRGRRGKNRRDFGKSRPAKVDPLSRRGSTTSQDSQLMTQVPIQMPNMGRRLGNAGLDERALKIVDTKNTGMLLPFLLRRQSASDENLSSEEKRRDLADKENVDIEMGNMEKEDEQDSDSEGSQSEDEVAMLDPENAHERKKNKERGNKNCKTYNHEGDRRSREGGHRGKYVLQDEAMFKHLLQEASDIKAKNENEKKEAYRKAVMSDLDSSLTSCYPELTRLLQGDGQTNAREMATQTSLPLDILEMEELKQSIDEIINSRHCSSKGTQISPQLKKNKNITT
ncbi:PREDICTED: protein smoothened isoform X2 [Wasmannia auropunctata]|uniref:protein smoothened isoform X2 n=1 Tax=Wasmannia auropunctata TaxID=64793 RepID=UPI0005EF9CED|nr:PREDICTED: protein smoothened isoform X2 [Wasmannia auropunctata]